MKFRNQSIYWCFFVMIAISSAGCSKLEDTRIRTGAKSETIIVDGPGPNLYTSCWHHMTFMTTQYPQGGVIQVMDTTGKPLECDK